MDFMRRCRSLAAGLLLLLASLPAIAPACIWVDGSTIDGHPKRHSPRMPLEWLTRAMEQTPEDKIREIGLSSVEGGAAGREKEAVKKMLSGDAAAAIPLLQKNEDESPDQYSTAANLGTAYELAGDNENALKWINEGIRRNPESHEGTEWLHALILETKLRLEKEPDYLKTHRIISLPEKFSAKTKVNAGGADREVSQIAWALGYQLRERVVFVKPPDPIVADLLYTYALCEARLGILESSLKVLKKSEEYGFLDPDLLRATAESYQPLIEKAQAERKVIEPARKYWVVFALGAVVIGYVVSLWWRLKKKLRKVAEVKS
jgi:tetratricopeptide (TPR) repeat protein